MPVSAKRQMSFFDKRQQSNDETLLRRRARSSRIPESLLFSTSTCPLKFRVREPRSSFQVTIQQLAVTQTPTIWPAAVQQPNAYPHFRIPAARLFFVIHLRTRRPGRPCRGLQGQTLLSNSNYHYHYYHYYYHYYYCYYYYSSVCFQCFFHLRKCLKSLSCVAILPPEN